MWLFAKLTVPPITPASVIWSVGQRWCMLAIFSSTTGTPTDLPFCRNLPKIDKTMLILLWRDKVFAWRQDRSGGNDFQWRRWWSMCRRGAVRSGSYWAKAVTKGANVCLSLDNKLLQLIYSPAGRAGGWDCWLFLLVSLSPCIERAPLS